MNLFGFEPYVGALIIAVLGIAGATIVGWLSKTGQSYDPRKVVASVIIGFPTAIVFVATELQAIHLPEDGGLTALIVVAGLVGQVAGFDMLIKTGVKAIGVGLNSTKSNP